MTSVNLDWATYVSGNSERMETLGAMQKHIFLASSIEATNQMDEIGEWIESFGHRPRPWTDKDVFPLNQSTLTSLHHVARQVDGALFVFGDEDKRWYRGTVVRAPRDNVLIEYGLFSGVLGQTSTAIATVGESQLASDLAGIAYVRLSERFAAKNKIRDWLNRIPGSPHETGISKLRGKFWSYHATQEHGKSFWRTGVADLGSAVARDRLLGEVSLLHADRKTTESYAVEGFTRDSRLILMLRHMSGGEPTVVRVFPSGGGGYSKAFAGLSFHMNYNQEPAVSPAILSRESLLGLEQPGFVEDPALIESLGDEWKLLLGATRLNIPSR
ncbi:MAG TPA: TIR domain-containing protein [Polyangiaceae bacterium]|nr:TIR domain-containing protein [Polyangiaceae bacterium]